MAGAAPRRGVDAAIAYYPCAAGRPPGARGRAREVLTSADGRRCAVEIAFTGTTTDGRLLVFDAVDLFELDGHGRVARLRSFYDTSAVAAQLRPPG